MRLDRAFAEGGADFPFYVTASAPEYFVIWPGMRGTIGLVEWRLELDWSCLQQHGTVTIDHGGRPFLSDGLRTRLLDWDQNDPGRSATAMSTSVAPAAGVPAYGRARLAPLRPRRTAPLPNHPEPA